ncbi:precorrin-3B C(17)-methyltransferase [Rhodoblastus sphagnicola]|uniref:Precorrin-3B C(17)-methyltransferase n=1 Tax=Rhodoblastus sphagnicola TaxID=333368 RepID=A0A2S6N903_9HYPH|nr:precorrin-3B C(17)-methyltransferase [Rhodoblastus sphagnicola]MBB4196870.1 precorrin-3B C17-methyltransferase [Rhodoblastus sphagnicola]PPQ31092.1 precorrin-3B C(17)-methyltransferase [Rhodoblastus sphagnicola]
MTGKVFIIGLGPGPSHWLTPQASAALDGVTDLIGYFTYVDRIPPRPGLKIHGSDNRVELDRSRHALELACEGKIVGVVSGGDPGVFAMAAAVLEAVENGPENWRALDIEVLPGVSAMQAAAARLGAPLGGDFCAISLSDNLKPWSLIERRLKAASEGDFVLALYNPASKARPQQIHDAFALLRTLRPAKTPVAFARAIGRPDERIVLTTLAEADPSVADMSTLVMIGATTTHLIERPEGRPFVLTPRSYEAER